ncbi:MAG: GIY-YIG nuclease family protein [Bacilli bacterium]|nr:GIY-YIG nuclease family protein [Bacilli bacterium]
MNKTYIIYKYTSPSGKGYIGQTCQQDVRARCHKSKNSPCIALSNSIKKYGYENFLYEILEEDLTLEEANIFEELYINEHNTLAPNGYNLTTGGNNYIRSDDTRRKMSKPKSEEHKLNMSKPKSEEHKLNIKKSLIGIVRTDEQKTKNGKAHSKKWKIIFPNGQEEVIIGLAAFCRLHNLCVDCMRKYNKNKNFKCLSLS